MFDFNKCHPIETDDLVRVGNENDGGYILSKRQIDKADIVLSFGIRDDWTFEEEFSKRKDVKIYSYDYSTRDQPFFTKKYGITYLAIVYNLVFLRFRRLRHHIGTFHRKEEFHRFFDGEKRFFIPKFLGQNDDERTIRFETIFRELGETGDLSVFLKMDIEGAEYQCLPEALPYLDKLNGMAVEFHNLDTADREFDELLNKLSAEFYVVHVHGCNFAKCIKGTDIPAVLEITFINKKLMPAKTGLSRRKHPVSGLDAPCNKYKKDYELKFTN
jgi:hypothetical protein